MRNVTRTCVIAAVLGSLATSALAEDVDDERSVNRAPDGQYAVMRGVQGPAGMVAARLLLDINLSADRAGKPISFAPDLYYSATDRLQLGVVHDGPMGWQARPGLGLCLTGKSNGCPRLYDNIGLDVMYAVALGEFRLSTHTSLFASTFDPFTASLAIGFTAKARLAGHVALLLDPKVAIALTKRNINDDALYVPLELQFQLGASTTLKLLSGLSGKLSAAFSDTSEIPVGIGLVQNLTRHLDLGARFSFDDLLGHQDMGVSRTDTRSLAILVNVRS